MATPSSPPTPSVSPPSLLQSSLSSSADTPLIPHTPPRGRSKYPSSLANDRLRVPLHRRGTSKTYECLEDLLKEAGYKETRIFTPETERHRGHERVHEEARQSDGKLKNGVDAVVGLLAGLVLGQPHGQPADPKTPRGDRVGPATLVPPPTVMHGTPLDTSSTAGTSLSQIQGAPFDSPSSTGPADNGRRSNVHPSPARAYLRHIASAPNIPRRRFLAERAPLQGARRSTSNLKNSHHTRRSPTPPMPPSWLGTVARAVLGFPGARIGGPNNIHPHSPSSSPPGQSRSRNSSPPTSRSSTVRGHRRTKQKHPTSPLKDTAARLQGRSTLSLPTSSDSLLPPTIPSMRSQVSPGQVVRINVVCRSAPASRSSSVVGRKPGPDSLASSRLGGISAGSVRGKGKARQSTRRNHRHKNRGRLTDSGPSLSDRVEGGYSSYSPGDGDDYDSFSEDEDEGEVDLSKLLVHVKRQHSIKSLQRHLQRASRHHGDDSSDVAGTWTVRGGDTSAAPSDVRGRIRRGSVNDGDWGVLIAPGSTGDSRSFHRRREIPVSWTQQSGSSRG